MPAMNLDQLIRGFTNTTTASISDVLDRRGIRGFMSHAIKARTVDKKIVGPAVTVREVKSSEARPPTVAIEAIERATPGSVIVIAVEDGADVAVWGGLMTAGAWARGLAGAVLDGGVRDVAEIRRDYQFPVYARSVVPSTTVGRYVAVERDVPVVCGGVRVVPGDIVVADQDGVVVVPIEIAEDVLKEALSIDEREARMAQEIRQGASLSEVIAKYARI